MAVGDYFLYQNSIPNTGARQTLYQPAAGVTIALTFFGADTDDVRLYAYDGTLSSSIVYNGSGTGTNPDGKILKCFIDNTIYLRAYNPSGGSRSFWVCGIQVT